mmetsp:Transcript_18802/g.47708  ORF Transcript_18802/g.47708 Transcript_18802/m.47708 type:complete len:204 (+) Transcript_18802:2-613(+)
MYVCVPGLPAALPLHQETHHGPGCRLLLLAVAVGAGLRQCWKQLVAPQHHTPPSQQPAAPLHHRDSDGRRENGPALLGLHQFHRRLLRPGEWCCSGHCRQHPARRPCLCHPCSCCCCVCSCYCCCYRRCCCGGCFYYPRHSCHPTLRCLPAMTEPGVRFAHPCERRLPAAQGPALICHCTLWPLPSASTQLLCSRLRHLGWGA